METVSHPDVAVLGQTVDRTETSDDWSVINILKHTAFADPDAGIILLNRLLRSPNTVKDLGFLRVLKPLLERNFPQYWDSLAELKYAVTFTDN